MSKSPYLSNPNILAHPDRVVQSVALDMTAQDSYLAGSPISAEGKLANDATAIGILLYDVHKQIGGTTGVVVISGRIDQEVAAEYSGVTISDDCKATLIDISFTGDGSRMGGGGGSGPIDPKRLPEGYPYKEQSRTALAMLNEVEFVASDISAHYEGIASEPFVIGEKYIAVIDGQKYEETAFVLYGTMAAIGNKGFVTSYGTWDAEDVPFAISAAEHSGQIACSVDLPPSEVGIHTVEIYKLSETVHPMAPEFLPALTSPNGTKYQLTVADDGTLSAVAQS